MLHSTQLIQNSDNIHQNLSAAKGTQRIYGVLTANNATSISPFFSLQKGPFFVHQRLTSVSPD